MSVALIKTYTAPPVSKKAILRYASCDKPTDEIAVLVDSCVKEAADLLSYKVCYIEVPVDISEDVCKLGDIVFHSKDLAKNLAGCANAVIFGATLGVEIDRLIGKYGHISPSRALILQAYGAERIEALCDTFCADIASGRGVRPRFSPGYGDLALEVQKDIFTVLGLSKNIGLFLLDSFLMSPSKSVTAIMGIERVQK